MIINTEEQWWEAVNRVVVNYEILTWVNELTSIKPLVIAATKHDSQEVLRLINKVLFRVPEGTRYKPGLHLLRDISESANVLSEHVSPYVKAGRGY